MSPRARVWLASALASTGFATLALTIASRVFFPWPLEWMEGGSLAHALRLAHAAPIYAAPSSEFIPYLYPPLGYVPMALATALFGPSLPAARLGAIACTLVTLISLARAGARTAKHPLGGAIASGLFAMGFGYTGAFLDLARVDACFIALVAAAAERLLAHRTRTALALLALSAFAKQHGVLLFAATAIALVARNPRRHARSVIATTLALLAVFALLELATQGWFARYTLFLPLSQSVDRSLFFTFFVVDLSLYLPLLVVVSGLAIARRMRRRLRPFDALFFAALLAGALGRAHVGGHDNVRLPAFLLLCSAATPWLTRAIIGHAQRRGVYACAALAFQLAMLWQAPSAHRPPARSAAEFAALRSALAGCAGSGDAVALDYAGLMPLPFLHTMALSDLLLGDDAELARSGKRALLSRLDSANAPNALAVGERFPELERVLATRYRPCRELRAPAITTGYRPGSQRTRTLIVYARAARE